MLSISWQTSELQQSRQECTGARDQLVSLNEDFKKCEQHATVLQAQLEDNKRELHDSLRLADDRSKLLIAAQEQIR